MSCSGTFIASNLSQCNQYTDSGSGNGNDSGNSNGCDCGSSDCDEYETATGSSGVEYGICILCTASHPSAYSAAQDSLNSSNSI